MILQRTDRRSTAIVNHRESRESSNIWYGNGIKNRWAHRISSTLVHRVRVPFVPKRFSGRGQAASDFFYHVSAAFSLLNDDADFGWGQVISGNIHSRSPWPWNELRCMHIVSLSPLVLLTVSDNGLLTLSAGGTVERSPSCDNFSSGILPLVIFTVVNASVLPHQWCVAAIIWLRRCWAPTIIFNKIIN